MKPSSIKAWKSSTKKEEEEEQRFHFFLSKSTIMTTNPKNHNDDVLNGKHKNQLPAFITRFRSFWQCSMMGTRSSETVFHLQSCLKTSRVCGLSRRRNLCKSFKLSLRKKQERIKRKKLFRTDERILKGNAEKRRD